MTKLLVVDDDERIRRFVTRVFEADGFQVDTAPNGHSALQLAEVHAYSLIILDLLMPGMDGYETLRRLVEADLRHRVLVISAAGSTESKVRCLRLGAVDYMPKPFAIAELVERVKRRLGEVRYLSTMAAEVSQPGEKADVPAPTRWLDAGGVRLDLHHRAIRIGERAIGLTQREFILLGHLMRHPNKVCSRGELLADVWGYSFDPGSNLVDVCIGRLRSKLKPHLIVTVRNVGYCFVATEPDVVRLDDLGERSPAHPTAPPATAAG